MFLGVTADVASLKPDNTEFSLILAENPLNDFVELPEAYTKLNYSNILCGVIRGGLDMVINSHVLFFSRHLNSCFSASHEG